MEYHFMKKWKEETKNKLRLLHPEWTDEFMDENLDKIIERDFKDHDCIIRNTYKNKEAGSSLLNLTQYIHERKPITAGYGVLYRNQYEAINPAAGMLLESINQRKALKKERSKYDKRSEEFATLDRAQLNEKVIANSYYGAGGAKTSIFYNRDIASSVTGTGQAEISTSETSIEAFLENNCKFYDIDDAWLFIIRVLQKTEYKDELGVLDNIREISKKYWRERFLYPQKIDFKLMDRILDSLSDEELTKIYFKNNLIEFFKYHKPTQKIMSKLINETKQFRNPNEIPEELVGDLEALWGYLEEFVVHDFPVRERIERDKAHRRKCCVTQDTDSTMVTLNKLMGFLIDEFADDEVAAESQDEFEFILINICAYILTRYCGLFLTRYTSDVNIPEKFRWMVNMKNEYYYPKMVLTEAKKHYLTLTKLQEGKEIKPPKIEAHGLEFAKAETSEITAQFFEKIIQDDIMYTDNINVSVIMRKIKDFEKTIRLSLEEGKVDFLSLKSVKEPEAYTAPYSEQGIRAVRNWNLIYSGMAISLPDKVLLIKLTIKKKKDLERMMDQIDPKYTSIIMREIFDNPNELIVRGGFDVIALPQQYGHIPEWLQPIINFTDIIHDNTKKFTPILKSLGAITLNTRATDAHVTNIINL